MALLHRPFRMIMPLPGTAVTITWAVATNRRVLVATPWQLSGLPGAPEDYPWVENSYMLENVRDLLTRTPIGRSVTDRGDADARRLNEMLDSGDETEVEVRADHTQDLYQVLPQPVRALRTLFGPHYTLHGFRSVRSGGGWLRLTWPGGCMATVACCVSARRTGAEAPPLSLARAMHPGDRYFRATDGTWWEADAAGWKSEVRSPKSEVTFPTQPSF